MSYERSTTDKVAPFAAGVGLYYIFVWVFTFYPAFIISLTLQRMFFGFEESGESYVFFIIAMIVGTFIILALVACRQYLIVLMMYIITAWPFLYILGHCWNNTDDSLLYPLPLDLWPLW